MKIKILSGDDPATLEKIANAWLEKCPKGAKVHFAMAGTSEESSAPGERPKRGGPYVEYGICLEYEEVVGKISHVKDA